jgi:hypothetical protein
MFTERSSAVKRLCRFFLLQKSSDSLTTTIHSNKFCSTYCKQNIVYKQPIKVQKRKQCFDKLILSLLHFIFNVLSLHKIQQFLQCLENEFFFFSFICLQPLFSVQADRLGHTHTQFFSIAFLSIGAF